MSETTEDLELEAAPAAAVDGLARWIGPEAATLFDRGGPALWAIAALSVLAVAIALWKAGQFAATGALGGRLARRTLAGADGLDGSPAALRLEIERAAKAALADLRYGLRGLEMVVAIAPLLGLLGTVLGMIAAFQALQTAGAQADPATLAGGVWEALLTTAAGMAVAIVASVALSWCESVVERNRLRLEDAAARRLAGLGG